MTMVYKRMQSSSLHVKLACVISILLYSNALYTGVQLDVLYAIGCSYVAHD